MTETVIKVNGLTKHFGDVVAVAGIDFAVQSGELFGFLGPNGAGKTTSVRLLTGVLRPTGGTAAIQEHDIRTQSLLSRAHIAVVPEEANVYLDLSVWRNIMLMADLYGIPHKQRAGKADELLEQLGLSKRKNQKARTLSKGLRQRLMLCAALVTEPEILFLDEPTSGLDVQSRQMIHRIIHRLSNKGLTIFLTTHNMEEAEKLCSRVAIIDRGIIAAIDTPQRLRTVIKSRQYVEVGFSSDIPERGELQALCGVSAVDIADKTVRLYTETPGRTATQLALFSGNKNLEIDRICTCKPSLEDVFLYFTNKNKELPEQ